MDAIFEHAPTEPTVIGIQVISITYSTACCLRRCRAQAITNIRPVDHIGRPQGNLDVCGAHAEILIARARSKGLEVEVR
jgi:hypothetical protein